MMVSEDENITLTKGKVAKIEENSASGDVTVTVEDILGGGKVGGYFRHGRPGGGHGAGGKKPEHTGRPRVRGKWLHRQHEDGKRYVRLWRRQET